MSVILRMKIYRTRARGELAKVGPQGVSFSCPRAGVAPHHPLPQEGESFSCPRALASMMKVIVPMIQVSVS